MSHTLRPVLPRTQVSRLTLSLLNSDHSPSRRLAQGRPPLDVQRGGDIVPLTRGGSANLQVASLMPSVRGLAPLPHSLRFEGRQVTHVPSLRKQTRFPVASIDFSRRDVGLPFGVPRYVNAATLKAIAGGKMFDRLLKKTDAGWEFVNNNAMIDLTDGSQEFKLGKLTIFS